MKKRLFRILLSLVLFLLSFFLPIPFWQNVLFFLAYLIVGFDILKRAFRNLFRGKVFDENFLMSIATVGAFCIEEFPEGVAVMLFYQIGELFQSYAVDKSRKSIASLMDIRPDSANVIRNKKTVKVSPEDVTIGDMLVVKPGEKIPLDGVVIEGESSLNTQALTGESIPRCVRVDDEVLSGCVNNDGILKIRVTKEFEDSTVSKILELVENASSRKSKSENFITKFARIYTPIVVLVAVFLVLFLPLCFSSISFFDSFSRALNFLVVSCPCALVISIPLSFFGGIGAASKKGILIKGSNYLEALSNVSIVVCDKTGTLTEGNFQVQDIQAIGMSNEELLFYAAHGEFYSNHPISLSLKQAYKEDLRESLVTKTKEISGKGVEALVDGKVVLVGNEKLMEDYSIPFPKMNSFGTVVFVAVDGDFAGTIVIADKIKEDSYQAVKDFKREGISRIVLLTGDSKSISEKVSLELQLDEYHAELLPQDKVSYVEQLMTQTSSQEKLLFVGDGVNDAPVLSLSDIGVAMGALGSDASIEAADVVIMSDEPSKIAKAIQISRKTMRIVRENIIFAIAVKIGVLVLSVFGISNMWMAVFADVGVSVLAILNALRVLYMKV